MGRGPLAAVTLAKVAASAAVLWAGFRAVSDDDFARVAIAEAWARAPRWDASGTSWLPLPFWVTGAAMKIAGRSLDTARATAALLGVAAALLVYAAARWMGEDRRAAAAGAVVAAVFPWSARLGVATVPELPTAALLVLAMAALTPADDAGRRRLLGGAALLAATLSRYEAWPVAAIFAGVTVVDAVRSPRSRALVFAGAAALALAGPAAWLLNNRLEHGDALHFLARVAAYRRALGEGGAAAPVWAYPLAVLREEPEIAALFAVAAGYTVFDGGLGTLRTRLAPYRRAAAVTAATVLALWLAQLKDGAPTHHPERAVLVGMLLVAMAGGALAMHALGMGVRPDGGASPHATEPRPERAAEGRLAEGAGASGFSTPPLERTRTSSKPAAPASSASRPKGRLAPGAVRNALGGAATLLAVALATWFVRPLAHAEPFAHRADEEAIGRAAASLARPGEPVLVEVADYGYLAVQAALGRPEDAVPDRSVDPRQAKTAESFADAAALRRRLAEAHARWAAARLGAPVEAVLGPPVTTRGAWGLFSAGGTP